MKVIIGANGQVGQMFKHLFPTDIFFGRADVDIENRELLHHKLSNYPSGTTIINCAAYTAVDKAEEENDLAIGSNSDGVFTLATVCKELGFNLIHLSTDYVFNGKKSFPYIEDDNTDPQTFYGHTKLLGENRIKESGVKYIILRTCWVYSEYGNNFLQTMIKLSHKEKITVVNDQFGTPTYALDLVNVIVQLAENFDRFKNQVYHFSNEGDCSWYEFAEEIMRGIQSKCKVIPIPSKEYPTLAERPKYSVLSKEKIKKDLGIKISHWKESLKLCLEKVC